MSVLAWLVTGLKVVIVDVVVILLGALNEDEIDKDIWVLS